MLRLRLLCIFLAAAALAVCCGCKDDGGTTLIPMRGNEAPQVVAIPDQQATKDFPFTLDLSAYITDDSDPVSSLVFLVVSGGGSFTGAIYQNTFSSTGLVAVQFLVLDTESGVTLGSFNVDVLSPPAADFTANVTYGPATLSVTFADQSTGEIDTWAWDFGDAGASSEQNPSHDYTAPGWYDVSLTVTGPGGSHTRTKYAYIQVLGGASNIWYVDAACVSATHDGLTWDTAFLEIDSGITAATDGDMVFVADGTYTGTSNKNLSLDACSICVRSYDLHGTGVCTIDCEGTGSGFSINTWGVPAVIDGFTIVHGDAFFGGGIICGSASCATIVNCTIMNCTATSGGAIDISEDSNVVVGNCVLTINTAGGGGAINIDGGTHIIANCTITGNHASGRGGGIYGHDSLGVTIDDCIIEDNTADQEGGGIAASYCPATVTNSSLSGNISGTNGASLYFYRSTITMTDCRIDANHATNGGGIYGDDSEASLYMTNCTVNDNAAAGWGGGIYLNRSTASLTDCSICGNETVASEANGGGIYAYQSEISLAGCTLGCNRVVSIDDPCGGGALQAYATNATLEGCSIYGNSAESLGSEVLGGGMYFRAMGEVSASIADCSVVDNTATGVDAARGGAICFMGVPSQVTGCTISGNTAYEIGTADVGEVYAGGIYSSPEDITISNCTVSGNTAKGHGPGGYEEGYGGGIYCSSNSVTVSGCTISDNTVEAQGDGAYGGGLCLENCTLTMDNCQVTGNSSITPTGNDLSLGGAGGIFMSSSTANLTDCTVSLNFTDCNGGGIYSATTNATIEGCTVANNTADSGTDGGAGGGIYIYTGNTILSATIISGNTASDSGPGWCGGGGLYFEKPVSASLTACTIENNISLGKGGGFALFDANLWLSSCVITGNTAGTDGGGMYLEGSCHPGMLNCLFAGNDADANGGGIHANGPVVLSIANCTVADNSADSSGGGAYLDSSTTAGTAWNTIFWGNSANTGDEIYTLSYSLSFINSDYANATGDIEGTGVVNKDAYTIHLDPLFVTGPNGGYYLNSDADAGADSPCIDGGNIAASMLELDTKTTRTDGAVDTGTVDMGYHYDP